VTHAGQLAAVTPRGLQMPQEWMINLDAGLIVLFMVPIAALTARIKRLRAIFIGIFIASAGLILAGATMSGAFCLLGIAVFAIGEMTASPKMNEYLGVIAPKGEEALYMGYANVPFAIGWTLADFFGGTLYDRLSDKANLAVRYLGEQKLLAPEALAAVKRTEAMAALQSATHLDATQATQLLWDTYHPYTFWYLFVGIGVASAFAMVVYARIARRWSHENA
jgi:MFS family permease